MLKESRLKEYRANFIRNKANRMLMKNKSEHKVRVTILRSIIKPLEQSSL